MRNPFRVLRLRRSKSGFTECLRKFRSVIIIIIINIYVCGWGGSMYLSRWFLIKCKPRSMLFINSTIKCNLSRTILWLDLGLSRVSNDVSCEIWIYNEWGDCFNRNCKQCRRKPNTSIFGPPPRSVPYLSDAINREHSSLIASLFTCTAGPHDCLLTAAAAHTQINYFVQVEIPSGVGTNSLHYI